jgi:23S rRNA (cytidine1920-2'-O)/16S rRNA (cytidine1409-2'-O)-methyltransferase
MSAPPPTDPPTTDSPPTDSPRRFVSRGGLKLEAALEAFAVDVTGWRCADFGCNVGGFTDCLLQRGASHVVAVDTGYGALAYTLRVDERVTVRERTNALHIDPPAEPVNLVVIDLAWTKQERAIPAARRWLRPGGSIITLIKPHYEVQGTAEEALLVRGVLPMEEAEAVAHRVAEARCREGMELCGLLRSPIRGGKGKAAGNTEFLAWLREIE